MPAPSTAPLPHHQRHLQNHRWRKPLGKQAGGGMNAPILNERVEALAEAYRSQAAGLREAADTLCPRCCGEPDDMLVDDLLQAASSIDALVQEMLSLVELKNPTITAA